MLSTLSFMFAVFDCFRAENIQSAWQVYGVYIKKTKGMTASAVLYVRKSMYPHNVFILPPLTWAFMVGV